MNAPLRTIGVLGMLALWACTSTDAVVETNSTSSASSSSSSISSSSSLSSSPSSLAPIAPFDGCSGDLYGTYVGHPWYTSFATQSAKATFDGQSARTIETCASKDFVISIFQTTETKTFIVRFDIRSSTLATATLDGSASWPFVHSFGKRNGDLIPLMNGDCRSGTFDIRNNTVQKSDQNCGTTPQEPANAAQMSATRNAQRLADVNTILTALHAYAGDHDGNFPIDPLDRFGQICIPGSDSCRNMIDLSMLLPTYLKRMPLDPLNSTGYFITVSANGSITVFAPHAENGTSISVEK